MMRSATSKQEFDVVPKGLASLRKSFDILVSNGSLHGFKEIVESNHVAAKLFWFIISFGFLGASIVFIVRGIDENLSMPVATNMQYRTADELRLPQFIVCPSDRYSKVISDQMGADMDVLEYIELMFPFQETRISVDDGHSAFPLTRYKSADEKSQRIMNKYNVTNIYELSQALQFPCEYFVEAMWFASSPISPCNTEIGPFFTFTDYGTCLHFNLTNQVIAGMSGGLTVVLNLPMENETYVTRRTFPGHAGFGIPYDRSNTNSGLKNLIFFERGKFIDITFRAENLILLPSPGNPCVTDAAGYDRNKCVWLCLAEHSQSGCNCVPVPTADDEKNVSYCTPLTFRTCVGHNASLSDLLMNYKDLERQCRDSECRELCNQWSYHTRESAIRLQSEIGERFNKNARKVENQIKINLYANGIEYITMRQFTTVTFTSIISRIGSTLGLWVGGSIVSLVEAFFYGIIAIGGLCGCIVVRYVANHEGEFSLKLRFRRRTDDLSPATTNEQSHSNLFHLFSQRVGPLQEP